MKRFLPVILVAAGILVLAVGIFIFRMRSSSQGPAGTEEEAVPEVPLSDRPVVSLTPSKDGHWLEMKIEKIKIDAVTLDYELLYKLPDGRTQGVPGTIKLTGETLIERDLLLGSESSGKFRYDEGVETGTLTLRFRDGSGKLVTRFVTNFHLQSNTKVLTSINGKFSYTLDKNPGSEFFVTMETFGLPAEAPGEVKAGSYGVFKGIATINIKNKLLPITNKLFPGDVSIPGGSIYKAKAGTWEKLTGGKSDDVGIFVGTSS